mmetsp:Transcript_17624/g.46143  ORF Transcript_17624/g.46143 Transcript_17624/m.46143 type:complete len:110 (-) Transcript_17624:830-1159(-)
MTLQVDACAYTCDCFWQMHNQQAGAHVTSATMLDRVVFLSFGQGPEVMHTMGLDTPAFTPAYILPSLTDLDTTAFAPAYILQPPHRLPCAWDMLLFGLSATSPHQHALL